MRSSLGRIAALISGEPGGGKNAGGSPTPDCELTPVDVYKQRQPRFSFFFSSRHTLVSRHGSAQCRTRAAIRHPASRHLRAGPPARPLQLSCVCVCACVLVCLNTSKTGGVGALLAHSLGGPKLREAGGKGDLPVRHWLLK